MKNSYLKIIVTCISLIVFIAVLDSSTYGQLNSLPIDEETGLITYKEVVEEEGTKKEYFNRAIGWINNFYKNPVDVTKTRDPESGIIKGIHRFKIKNKNEDGSLSDDGIVQYQFLLEFKEGRYRYTLTEFVLRQASKIPAEKWLSKSDPQSKSYLKQLDEFAQNWITELKKGMQPKVEKKDDEW
ncbi:MAG: DUF4468 domain-containing protein [Bacteroidales bacterium]|nr:DUF4468 domain-containing protein [Bacteroidales bacterium]